jgi:hypothetical protein
MRREFTRTQKGQMLKRAMDERGRIRCEGCGMDVTGKAVEFDHRVPEAMLLAVDKAKPLTIEDGQLLGAQCCHRAPGGKTARDMGDIAKAKRREALAGGFKTKTRNPMPGSKASGIRKRMDGTVEKRR